MRAVRLSPLLFSCLILTACVTINVYFPAVAAEKAADRIVKDVYGQPPPSKAPAGKPSGSPSSFLNDGARSGTLAIRLLNLMVPEAEAAQANIDISSPAIDRLTRSMKNRFPRLKPYFDSGAIGLTANALITLRAPGKVPLKDRNTVRKLVADENTDRNALYHEIAVANGHPEWESRIRNIFAQRWVSNAPRGWWYQTGQGAWKQK